jgi:hypothetical protein
MAGLVRSTQLLEQVAFLVLASSRSLLNSLDDLDHPFRGARAVRREYFRHISVKRVPAGEGDKTCAPISVSVYICVPRLKRNSPSVIAFAAGWGTFPQSFIIAN